MIFGFGSLVLMMLPSFVLIKPSCKEILILDPRLCICTSLHVQTQMHTQNATFFFSINLPQFTLYRN